MAGQPTTWPRHKIRCAAKEIDSKSGIGGLRLVSMQENTFQSLGDLANRVVAKAGEAMRDRG